eukprot:CAMPEP_0119269446 /NCGR_PEP_ID=MMETSP1329-20130426/6859_1 /TAXON_ID=114041 /ORGANISM="Genus nov. species nov., Strain RCC1024" /LENGTH=117 /DNA_ID=CAMNT_0007269445 /DNA_START=263 /DNA_END=613 /DNA_ORIENTATION=+
MSHFQYVNTSKCFESTSVGLFAKSAHQNRRNTFLGFDRSHAVRPVQPPARRKDFLVNDQSFVEAARVIKCRTQSHECPLAPLIRLRAAREMQPLRPLQRDIDRTTKHLPALSARNQR